MDDDYRLRYLCNCTQHARIFCGNLNMYIYTKNRVLLLNIQPIGLKIRMYMYRYNGSKLESSIKNKGIQIQLLYFHDRKISVLI